MVSKSRFNTQRAAGPLNLSGPQFPQLRDRNDVTSFTQSLGELNKISVKVLEQSPRCTDSANTNENKEAFGLRHQLKGFPETSSRHVLYDSPKGQGFLGRKG